jgi:hypothetical protein
VEQDETDEAFDQAHRVAGDIMKMLSAKGLDHAAGFAALAATVAYGLQIAPPEVRASLSADFAVDVQETVAWLDEVMKEDEQDGKDRPNVQ